MLAGAHSLEEKRPLFPSLFAARCGHVTKFWSMACKGKSCMQFWEVGSVLERSGLPLFLLTFAWNLVLMAAAQAATLGYEVA